MAFGIAGLVWMLLPIIETKHRLSDRAVLLFGVTALAYLGSMTIYGYMAT
jgi:hypothetical protein